MSYIKQAFDAVRAMVLAAQTTYTAVVVGGLPPDDGLCMQVSTGSETQTFNGGESSLRVVCVLNDKHASQETAFDTLCSIHEALNRTRVYPSGTGWEVTSIKSTSLPNYAGMDGDQYLYVSSIEFGLECD